MYFYSSINLPRTLSILISYLCIVDSLLFTNMISIILFTNIIDSLLLMVEKEKKKEKSY